MNSALTFALAHACAAILSVSGAPAPMESAGRVSDLARTPDADINEFDVNGVVFGWCKYRELQKSIEVLYEDDGREFKAIASDAALQDPVSHAKACRTLARQNQQPPKVISYPNNLQSLLTENENSEGIIDFEEAKARLLGTEALSEVDLSNLHPRVLGLLPTTFPTYLITFGNTGDTYVKDLAFSVPQNTFDGTSIGLALPFKNVFAGISG